MRREYPDLATRQPAPDDEEIFGEAWPLIVEWRGLKDAHPNEGKGLDWLTAQERVLELELALLEEHGMTLPPEKQPLLEEHGMTLPPEKQPLLEEHGMTLPPEKQPLLEEHGMTLPPEKQLLLEEHGMTLPPEKQLLLEEHGMTLPPEKQSLRGLDRSGQTSWRRTALYDTRRARRKAELLRKVRRVVTLGLWRR